jgi:RecA-family ATPase
MHDVMTPDDWEALWQAQREAPLDARADDLSMNVVPVRAGSTLMTGKEKERASRFFPASDLDGFDAPHREWLVEDLVPSGTVTLLGGDGGTGKSLLSLQLACAVALHGKWLGRSVKPGRALFISAEDDTDELHRRISDITEAEGVTLGDLHRMTIRSLAGEDALMATLDRQTGALFPSPLFLELDRRIADERPAVVILDTLADLFPGNENDRAQARQFIGLLRGLAIRHECALLLLAHPSLSGLNSGAGTSGSTGWNNSVRSRLYFARVQDEGHEADPDLRVLRTMKANYGRTGGEMCLRWVDGVFAPISPETGIDRMAANAKAERVFLKLLREFASENRTLSDKNSSAYAPMLFAKSGRAEGCTKRMLEGAMETLFSQGKIKMVEGGPPSRPVRTMVEVF